MNAKHESSDRLQARLKGAGLRAKPIGKEVPGAFQIDVPAGAPQVHVYERGGRVVAQAKVDSPKGSWWARSEQAMLLLGCLTHACAPLEVHLRLIVNRGQVSGIALWRSEASSSAELLAASVRSVIDAATTAERGVTVGPAALLRGALHTPLLAHYKP
jgi:hypothetical protein